MKTPKEIKILLNNKVLANINLTAKEENQDIITFKGKEYEFIESTWGDFCINCDLRELDNCTLFPRICCSEYRRDMREGYFKLIKQKELELIGGEFYKDVYKGETAVISIIDKQSKWDNDYVHTTHSLIIDFKKNHILTCRGRIAIDYFKKHYSLATPEEKQLLIDKVQEVTGKVWNEETKMFENKPKEILVPDNIKIVKFFPDIEAPNLGLVFNEGKQILNHRIEYNCYAVYPYVRFFYKEVKCKLIPTLFQDLKVGDMFFYDSDWGNLDKLINYSIYLGEWKFAFIYNNGVMIDDKPKKNVYKVVPINN